MRDQYYQPITTLSYLPGLAVSNTATLPPGPARGTATRLRLATTMSVSAGVDLLRPFRFSNFWALIVLP